MRIAIDASATAERPRTGIGNYVSSLLHGLSELDGENQYFVCHRLSRLRRWRNLLRIPKPNFRGKIIQEPFNFFFMRRLDVFHGPDARLPRSRATKMVATVHDLFSLLSDDYADAQFRQMKAQRYQEIVDRAARIIVDSESTRRDLCQLLSVDPRRITVIPLGVSGHFCPRSPDEAALVLRKLAIDRPYLLSVGVLSARKNTRRVIEAFHALSRGSGLLLVLAGRPGPGWEAGLAAIEELALGDRVRLVGSVADADLPALYSAARAFLFPSLREGFGMPVLEAMACGTPVVTSNSSSLPEVAGDAALLVDPLDTGAIAEATRRLLEDEALARTLAARGIERARLFPWSRTARETLQVYRQVAERGP
ncbi:MAG: glycosyltransferase family 4 protein [Planctomycetes bacterium]|nr:glycosyltransferase family 4 protein [Planctomycetota bacterium]